MIQSKIEDPLAEELLAGHFAKGDAIDVTLKKNEITFVKKKTNNKQPTT